VATGFVVPAIAAGLCAPAAGATTANATAVPGRSLASDTKSDTAASRAAAPVLPDSRIGAQATPDLAFATKPGTTKVEVRPAPDGSAAPIARALSAAKPGQAIVLRAGTYTGHLHARVPGAADKPIRLVAAPGEKVVLRGVPGDNSVVLRISAPFWIVRGIEVDARGASVDAVRVDGTSDVLLDGLHVHSGSGRAGVVFSSAVRSGLRDSKVHGFDRGTEDSHGVLITGSSHTILVRGNDSWGNSGDSVQCAPFDESGRSTEHPREITIDFNRFGGRHPNGLRRPADRENAVDIKECTGVSVRANKMMGYRAAASSPQGTALVAHFGANRVLIEHNRIWDSNLGASMGSTSLRGEVGEVVFRRNVVFNMVQSGLGAGKYAGGVRVSPASHVEIYNNTFYRIPADTTPTKDRNYAIRLADDGPVGRAVVINNLIDGTGRAISGKAAAHTESNNLAFRTPSGLPGTPLWRGDPVLNDFYTRAKSAARDAGRSTGAPYCGRAVDVGFLETCSGDNGDPAVNADVARLVASFVARIPGAGSEAYRRPTSSQAHALSLALAAARRGELATARATLALIDYDVQRVRDVATRREILVLRERTAGGSVYRHAWGLYLIRPRGTGRLVVEVAHPKADIATEDVGVAAFRAADAVGLLIAGAHRRANSNGSADVAHQTDSAFHVAHTTLVRRTTTVLQPHGFSLASHPGYPDAVVSSGTDSPSSHARAVRARLVAAGFSTCLYARGSSCGALAAKQNKQGIATRDVGGSFVSLELSNTVRASGTRRRSAGRAAALALR
jgi:hypothetical protein